MMICMLWWWGGWVGDVVSGGIVVVFFWGGSVIVGVKDVRVVNVVVGGGWGSSVDIVFLGFDRGGFDEFGSEVVDEDGGVGFGEGLDWVYEGVNLWGVERVEIVVSVENRRIVCVSDDMDEMEEV